MHVYSIKKFQNISNKNGAGELSPALFLKLQKNFLQKSIDFLFKVCYNKDTEKKTKKRGKKMLVFDNWERKFITFKTEEDYNFFYLYNKKDFKEGRYSGLARIGY